MDTMTPRQRKAKALAESRRNGRLKDAKVGDWFRYANPGRTNLACFQITRVTPAKVFVGERAYWRSGWSAEANSRMGICPANESDLKAWADQKAKRKAAEEAEGSDIVRQGTLIYKCRLCGAAKRDTHTPDVMTTIICVMNEYKLPFWGVPVTPTSIHNCADGRLGVSDLIGGEHDKPEVA